MQNVDTLFEGATLPDGTLSAIAVADGRIVALEADATASAAARDIVDLGGALVVPGFVEGHVHLDTSFYAEVHEGWREAVGPTLGRQLPNWPEPSSPRYPDPLAHE